MKKKLAFIMSALLLTTAGCGNIDNGNEAGEETTAAEETEIAPEEETAEETTAEETTAEETTEAETTSEPVTETGKKAANNADTSDYIKVLTDLKAGMKRDEVFAIIGDDYTYETEYFQSTEYCYHIECDDIFGTGLSGDMFVEFYLDSGEYRCGGFHLGTKGHDEDIEYPYGENELREAFDKILPMLEEKFGTDHHPYDLVDDASIKGNYNWQLNENESLWAMWGTGLWGEDSPVNEILISRSVEQ